MPDIMVLRGDATSQGDDVVDPLMTVELVLLQRGARELDVGTGLSEQSIDIPYREGLMLGMLVRYFDTFLGKAVTGKITSISHNIELANAVTNLRLAVVSEMVL